MEVAQTKPGVEWLGSLQSLAVTVVIAVFVITFIIQAFQIPSASMENTLLVGDYLLVDKLRYGGGSFGDFLLPYQPVRRGDVIVFKYPVNPSEHFVKRVIGIPGDHLRMIQGRVYVNGQLLVEPYVRVSGRAHDEYRDEFPQLDISAPGQEGAWWLEMKKLVADGQLIIPKDKYFVLGDNRDDSLDSRYWGFVPRPNIVGRPLLIYWSVRDSNTDLPETPTVGDKLFHFVYAATHFLQITRWDRTLRVVK